jgi:hypothetical protein
LTKILSFAEAEFVMPEAESSWLPFQNLSRRSVAISVAFGVAFGVATT